jgi:hypothetical protein
MKELKFGPPLLITNISENLRTDLLLEGVKQKDDARSKLVGHIENEKMYSELLKNKFESDILIKIEEYIEWIKIERSIKHTNYKTRLNGLWINRQKSGEHNPPHRHFNGTISFVIYLDFPEEIKNEQPFSEVSCRPGTISFLYGNNTQLDVTHQTELVNKLLSPQAMIQHMPTKGEMIIFPSYLIHYVSPFYTKGVERISVSGNISVIQTEIKSII